jgi:hypothetical protein
LVPWCTIIFDVDHFDDGMTFQPTTIVSLSVTPTREKKTEKVFFDTGTSVT